jgi:23S rRNA (guanosine2251-2'-O)-methyltransferase
VIIYGANPVREALRAKKKIREIRVARAEGAATRKIKEAARAARVKLIETTREELTKKIGHEAHQGVMAVLDDEVSDHEVFDDDEPDVAMMLAAAADANEEPLIVIVDHVTDPHNLGAIIRSAWALGAHGVIIPKDRSAQVTPVVVRASAGAALHVKIAKVVNIKHALEELKEAGVWSVAAVLDGEPAATVRMDGPIALVVGAEDRGVAPTVAARCDHRVRIPLAREFDSLNASVAAGILLYEIQRQRGA